MRRPERALIALLLAVAAGAALAQSAGGESGQGGWTEGPVPPPPPLHTRGLITLDMGPDARLHFGVDPASLAIAPDGVVRYVVVASSDGGAVNAMYEGIRCATSELETYARTTSSGDWHPVQEPHWRSIYESSSTRYAVVLAEQGLCNGKAPARSIDAMLEQLKGPPQAQRRYY